jgi:twitching motility protein PilT
LDRDTMNRLLTLGAQNGASDIHFRPGDPPTYRVNGALRTLKGEKLGANDTRAIALTLISDPELQAKIDTVQEFDGSYSVPGVSRFRANVYRQRGSLSIIMRIIPAEIPTIDSLGLPQVLKKIASSERGLVLVTGATGSGKSSTLAAMIDHINRNESLHILSIEDPIEFIHRNQKSWI